MFLNEMFFRPMVKKQKALPEFRKSFLLKCVVAYAMVSFSFALSTPFLVELAAFLSDSL